MVLTWVYLNPSPDSFEYFTSIIEDKNDTYKETRILMGSHIIYSQEYIRIF